MTKAKDLLFEVAERCKSVSTGPLDIPRNKSRVAEDGRAKAYVNEILNLWEVLDTAKASLPYFGAVDIKRYPPVALADSDMFGLTVNVLDVRSQMTDVKSQVSTMMSQMKKMEESRRLLAERLNHDGTAKDSPWPTSTWLLRQPFTCQPRGQFLVPSAPTSLLFRRHLAHLMPPLWRTRQIDPQWTLTGLRWSVEGDRHQPSLERRYVVRRR